MNLSWKPGSLSDSDAEETTQPSVNATTQPVTGIRVDKKEVLSVEEKVQHTVSISKKINSKYSLISGVNTVSDITANSLWHCTKICMLLNTMNYQQMCDQFVFRIELCNQLINGKYYYESVAYYWKNLSLMNEANASTLIHHNCNKITNVCQCVCT